MTINNKALVAWVLLLIFPALSLVALVSVGIAVSLGVASALALTWTANKKNLFHQMWMIGYWSFSVLPLIVLNSRSDFSATDIVGFSISSILTVFALYISRSIVQVGVIRKNLIGNVSVWLLVFLYAFSLFDLVVLEGRLFFFYFPAMLMISSDIIYAGKLRQANVVFLAIVCLIALYVSAYWSGSGRLIIAGWTIVPLVIFFGRYGVLLSPLMLSPAISVIAYMMQSVRDVRYLTLNSLFTVNDRITSVTSPHVLSVDFLERAGYGGLKVADYPALFDQYLLFFLQFFPRAFWSDKPLGFGYDYTVNELSESLANAGHSVAALFWGEHVYYVGWVGVIFVPASVFLVAAVTKVIYKKYPDRLFYVLAVMWIPTFYWGGMASYSGRFLTGSFLAILLVVVIDIVRRARNKLL